MKLYYIQYLSPDHGHLEAFGSKREAEKRLAELNRERRQWLKDNPDEDLNVSPFEMIYPEIYESEFPISKKGIIAAFNEGAETVPK